MCYLDLMKGLKFFSLEPPLQLKINLKLALVIMSYGFDYGKKVANMVVKCCTGCR